MVFRWILRACLIGVLSITLGTVVLWNWPTGFYRVATAIGRFACGVKRTTVAVRGVEVPTLDSAPSEPAEQPDSTQKCLTPILFLHGYGTSKEAMLREMDWFSRSRRVIAPDLPAFGENPLAPNQPALDGAGYVRWIEEFRVAANLGRVDVVGESMGGAFAAAYAATYPDSVRRLVLQSAAGVRAPRANAVMTSVARGENPLEISCDSDFDRVVGLCFAHPPFIPAPMRTYLVARALSQQSRSAEVIDGLREFLQCGVEPLLPAIKAPTLILYGDADAITDCSMLAVYSSGIAGSHALLIPSAGHVIFADAPTEARREVSNFLDR